jgi:hypothetical protein
MVDIGDMNFRRFRITLKVNEWDPLSAAIFLEGDGEPEEDFLDRLHRTN